ncbi:MAG: hypothetical protein SEPTF4163_003904 [Sporothrix epigloea]
MSFAKVAASATKRQVCTGNTVPNEALKNASSGSPIRSKPRSSSAAVAKSPKKHLASTKITSPALAAQNFAEDVDVAQSIGNGLDALKIAPRTPGLVDNVSALITAVETTEGPKATANTSSSQPLLSSDDILQKSDLSSEIGTKPPSLDGKSITSGMTFNALDEKESLRPDDSASVKAAADEDETFSVRRSHLMSSRMGSELAARGQRMIQLGDMPPRMVSLTSHEPVASGAVTPHSTLSGQLPVTEASVHLRTSASTPSEINGQNPDEKLLDAMTSPKNRVFLLRLESDVVDFVQNSKEPFMDLPPSNSFCRMLTHKLADYYHMTHSFEAVAGAVRIYRTPFCRVPPPLASMVPIHISDSSTSTPLHIVRPTKIMRRGEEFEQSNSATPSKQTSEDGSDSKDKALPAKEKMSREQREEAYNKARERIFAMPTESSTPENDDGTGMSRASSISAKDRGNTGKKGKTVKQRRDDSESFESRSQFTPFYHQSQQATWVNPHFVPTANLPIFPYGAQENPAQIYPPQQHHQQMQMTGMQQHGHHFDISRSPQIAYGTTQAAYPPAASSMGHAGPANNGLAQYPPQPGVPSRYPAQSGPPVYPYVPGGQGANTMPPRPWQPQQQMPTQPSPYNGAIYLRAHGRSRAPVAGASYPYGQLPAPFNHDDTKLHHPIPGSYVGSYSRHGFNPKTQSFVPGTGLNSNVSMPASNPVVGPHSAYGPNGVPMQMGMGTGQVQGGGVPYGNGGYHQAGLSTSPYGGNSTSSYGMLRQGSGNSVNSFQIKQMPYAGPMPTAYPDAYRNGQLSYGAPHGAPRGPSYHKSNGPQNNTSDNSSNSFESKKMNGTQASMRPNSQAKNPQQSHKGNGQAYGSLPNYGNLATLPQKPTST